MNYRFSIPNIDYYPPDLDDSERDKIKAAELRAAQVVALKQSSVRLKAEEEALLLRDWVLPIFAAFSKLAVSRAKVGAWAIHKADSESREFLKALAASAGMNSADAWMAGGGRIIRAEIKKELEDSSEWKRHQEELLELINAQDNAVVPTNADIGAPNGSEPKKATEALFRGEEVSTRQSKPQVPAPALLAATPSQGIADGAMAAIPALSDPTKRKLAILWDTVRDKQKLTEEDVTGYDLGRQWLSGVVAKPPHGMKLAGLNIGHTVEGRKAAAGWLGGNPSVSAAQAWFRGIESEYWSLWCTATDGMDYKAYRAWLDSIKRDIVVELESIWMGRSAVTDRWFENTCRPALQDALSTLIRGRISQAQTVAMERLDRKARTEAWARAVNGNSPKAIETTRNTNALAKEGSQSRINATNGNAKRLSATITSPVAARRMETYMESHGGQTKFAVKAGTTDRTLRSFRRTGKVRQDIFDNIARAMETTREDLLEPE
jgi:hypothetical protein